MTPVDGTPEPRADPGGGPADCQTAEPRLAEPLPIPLPDPYRTLLDFAESLERRASRLRALALALPRDLGPAATRALFDLLGRAGW